MQTCPYVSVSCKSKRKTSVIDTSAADGFFICQCCLSDVVIQQRICTIAAASCVAGTLALWHTNHQSVNNFSVIVAKDGMHVHSIVRKQYIQEKLNMAGHLDW